MDVVTAARPDTAAGTEARRYAVSAEPATPPENRLLMPVQSFRSWKASDRRKPALPKLWTTPWLKRLFVFGGGMVLTAYGAWEMYNVVSVSRTTSLQYVLLVLFTVNFSWIALAFTSALLGFFGLLVGSGRTGRVETLQHRTVVVMPIYNESTARTFAALAAIKESVEATGLGAHFDYFIVSDTTNADVWIAEERAFLALREKLGPEARVYYRHRPKNHHRKAGNIADFVTRWGGYYEHMVVLDADSLMTGTCIVRLAAAMEADPDSGIIQSLPLIINRNTFFARLQQFAARVYGPVIATGLAMWSGRDGNYWGHNAIIRTKAFADHCGLPDLKGKPPFGGHVLSHDFVEAALMRRAGWSVYMLPDLTGSYEESPPSLIDISVRDRRWCQGNLQHSRIIGAKGFVWSTRQHFATGIMGYLASPFWLMQLVVGILIVLQVNYARPEYFTQEFTLFPVWPRFDPERALNLFALTMAILLAPKGFGLILTLVNGKLRRAGGGAIRLIFSALLEILFSAFFAPIMMLIQSGSVFQILLGRDTGWNPQRRDDGSIPLKDIIRRHRTHTVLGVVAGISAFMIATSLFAWMSPTIVGLVLAIPLSWASGQLGLGLWLKRHKLLVTPEEGDPPAIALRANALQAEFAEAGFDEADGLVALHADAALRHAHDMMLPEGQPRRRGEIEPDRAVAQAKLVDAETIEDAAIWLKPKERMVVLHDRALVGLLATLPKERAPA
ncbi:glucans biosynthesis glucosyltransferase MdoH [Bosea sp. 685]|uniref:glucans biosynthesis glucosyltransferase MdoH n=1 Tax=Bosea sp. 685 TaxID=3080057 RepID=UPI0028937AC5|nr:glucans biosynthesis glucosyltransferase MdoH [Bosea sp. 685]WNJ93322.1 glucans biosynthesis glucosyltransferase MdoH [Bosea sp. 685]